MDKAQALATILALTFIGIAVVLTLNQVKIAQDLENTKIQVQQLLSVKEIPAASTSAIPAVSPTKPAVSSSSSLPKVKPSPTPEE